MQQWQNGNWLGKTELLREKNVQLLLRPQEIGNTEIFRTHFTTFRRERHARGGGVFICVKNNIDCSELWTDDEFEIIAVEIKGSDPKCKWEIVGIYRAPNEDTRVIESWLSEPVFWEILRSVAL